MFVAVLLTLGIGTGGCQSTMASRVVEQSQSGSSIELRVGQELQVKLRYTAGTGYVWEASDNDGQVLQQVGTPRNVPDDPGVIGGTGTQVDTFRAAGTGTVELKMVYRRPWETDVAPAKTFQVSVSVK